MKVLHLIPSIGPTRGGPSHAVIAMVRTLRQVGVDARIVCTDDNGSHRLDVPLLRWTEWSGVPVQFFPFWTPRVNFLREFAVSPSLTRWLRRELRGYDLLHCHAMFSYPSTAGMCVARELGVPYILRSIGQLNVWSLQHHRLRKQLYLSVLERRNIDGAASMHFTSRAEKDEVESQFGKLRSFVVPLGVDMQPRLPREEASQRLREFCPGLGDAPKLLFLSRLHPKKRLEVLLQALAACKDANWQLLIAGVGDEGYVRQLQDQARQLGIGNRCRWLGFVEGHRKQAILAGCDWFVLPSASENFGIAVVESLAAGTPVILSPGVAVSEDVQRACAGLTVESSKGALEQTLRGVLADVRGWPRFRENAARLAEASFGWARIGERLIREYRAIALDTNLPSPRP